MNAYIRIIDYINKAMLWLIGILLFIIFSLLVSQVFFRYVLNASLSWTDEAARYLTIWIVFLGTSLSLRNKSLIAVEVINEFLPQKAIKIFRIIVLFLSITFCLFLIYYGVIMANTVANQNSIALDLPMWIPYLAIPVGALLIMLNIFVEIFEIIKEGSEEVEKSN